MQKIKEPNFYYKEYSEKIIANIFAMKTDKVDRLIREARQALSKEDYHFEITNVINSLTECEENDVESEFRSILWDVDKDLYRLITLGNPEPVVVNFENRTPYIWTQEETIREWAKIFRKMANENISIEYDYFCRAIKDIGFLPDTKEWHHWQVLAELSARTEFHKAMNFK